MGNATDDGEEQIAADVEEFAIHDRKGGWARALLVARRVQPDEGNGVHLPRCFDRNTFRRISAREFARRSGTTAKRIMAFYQAWQRAADDGLLPAAADLTPGVHVELPDEDEVPFFGENGYYRSYESRQVSDERRNALVEEAERAGIKPTGALAVATNPKALWTAVLADDTSRNAAVEAIAEFERRQTEADRTDREAARAVTAEREAAQSRDDGQGSGPVSQAEADEIAQAVRGTSRTMPEKDVALEVFSEMTAVRLATLRALTLLQQQSIAFTGERGRAIAELCDASRAAISFIRDLASSPYTALNDDALQAFLDESEKKLG